MYQSAGQGTQSSRNVQPDWSILGLDSSFCHEVLTAVPFFQPTLLSLTISSSKLETTSVVVVSTENLQASSLEKGVALGGHQSDDELIHDFETPEEELPKEYFTSFYLLGSFTGFRMNICTGVNGFSYIALVISQIRRISVSQINWICCF
jgi:hypothetical protein